MDKRRQLGNVIGLETIPIEIIGIIASNLPFRQFMAVLNSTKKYRKLLAQNDLWSCQIEKFFGTSVHRNKPNNRRTFKWIYENRKKFEPATLAGFRSAYVAVKVSDKSDDSGIPSLRNVILDDTLFVYQTKKSKNVNVVLSTNNGKPFFIRSIKISGALDERWLKAPSVSAGLIFLFDEEPDLKKIAKFNSLTKQQWNALTAKHEGIEALQRAGCPVYYFEGLENEVDRKLFINFEFPFPTATHVVLKMLRSCDTTKETMTLANFILYGGAADATSTNINWKTNAEPDDIDMGGLSDYEDDGGGFL